MGRILSFTRSLILKENKSTANPKKIKLPKVNLVQSTHSYLQVSRRFNELCASALNSTFRNQQSSMLRRLQELKDGMPRRESARRNHPLAREADIVDTVHMSLSLLEMTFGKHINRKHICFFAGEARNTTYELADASDAHLSCVLNRALLRRSLMKWSESCATSRAPATLAGHTR